MQIKARPAAEDHNTPERPDMVAVRTLVPKVLDVMDGQSLATILSVLMNAVATIMVHEAAGAPGRLAQLSQNWSTAMYKAALTLMIRQNDGNKEEG